MLLRTLYIVWSLLRRRVTRRLTRLQTMCNVLKYRRILYNVALRLRCGCVYFFNLLKTSTVKYQGLAISVDSFFWPVVFFVTITQIRVSRDRTHFASVVIRLICIRCIVIHLRNVFLIAANAGWIRVDLRSSAVQTNSLVWPEMTFMTPVTLRNRYIGQCYN